MTVTEFYEYCKKQGWENEFLFATITDERDLSWNNYHIDEDRIVKTEDGVELIAELTELINPPRIS